MDNISGSDDTTISLAQSVDLILTPTNSRPDSPPVVMSVVECESLLESKMLEIHGSKILFESKCQII